MKTEKVLISILVVLILFIFVAPAMAESPKKIPVTLKIKTSAAVDTPPEKTWTTDDGIIHKQGIIRTVALGTPPNYNVVLDRQGMAPLYGTIYAVVDSMENTKTGVLTSHYHPWIISFDGGTFEGVNTWTWDRIPLTPLDLEGHAVLQGTGVFEGQKLMIRWDYPIPYSGFLLIP